MFRTPSSRTSVAPIVLSDTPAEDLTEDLKVKKNQKRVREDEEEAEPKNDADGSPEKKLDPRRLVYPDTDDVLSKLDEDDGVQEQEPKTQPYYSDDEAEEGECTQESQTPA